FFQAEDGIRDLTVTGVQTCALPISTRELSNRGNAAKYALAAIPSKPRSESALPTCSSFGITSRMRSMGSCTDCRQAEFPRDARKIGRASCRERGEMANVSGT